MMLDYIHYTLICSLFLWLLAPHQTPHCCFLSPTLTPYCIPYPFSLTSMVDGNGEVLKAYTYLVFAPKNKDPSARGTIQWGIFWGPKRVDKQPNQEVSSTVGISPQPKLD